MLRRVHASLFLAAYGARGIRRRERGTVTVEKLIMIGMIVVPIVVLLIVFKEKLMKWFHDTVEALFKSSDTSVTGQDKDFQMPSSAK
jgi:hypothetical protein